MKLTISPLKFLQENFTAQIGVNLLKGRSRNVVQPSSKILQLATLSHHLCQSSVELSSSHISTILWTICHSSINNFIIAWKPSEFLPFSRFLCNSILQRYQETFVLSYFFSKFWHQLNTLSTLSSSVHYHTYCFMYLKSSVWCFTWSPNLLHVLPFGVAGFHNLWSPGWHSPS